jgi:Photosynthesis affected mutant 68
MSASWDDDREGTFLGTDEFSQNLENIKTGLSRSRENAILRDKLDVGMYTQEELDKIAAAEERKVKKAATFSEKMGDEMDS